MKVNIFTLFLVTSSGLNAEELLGQRILKMPEGEQIAFVKSFIADDLRKPARVDSNERGSGLGTLMMNKGDTFIPLFVEAIQSELKTDEALSNGIVYRAVGIITIPGSELALETVERLFRDDKVRFDRYIPVVLSSRGKDRRQDILKWYKALESKNADLRAAAVLTVQAVLAHEIAMEDNHQALTEAMASRYGHLPEAADFGNDPLIAAIEGKSMTIAYDTRRKVLEISDGMRHKKEQASKKQ